MGEIRTGPAHFQSGEASRGSRSGFKGAAVSRCSGFRPHYTPLHLLRSPWEFGGETSSVPGASDQRDINHRLTGRLRGMDFVLFRGEYDVISVRGENAGHNFTGGLFFLSSPAF